MTKEEIYTRFKELLKQELKIEHELKITRDAIQCGKKLLDDWDLVMKAYEEIYDF